MTDEEMDTANKMMVRAANDLQNFGVDSVAIVMALSCPKGYKKSWAVRGNHYCAMGAVAEFMHEIRSPQASDDTADMED